ncbi:hypothetical protein SCRM01_163c [Synechococcus phage S-CRM01]|uniref:hypothetical protein n=1 Tax=Synechococcus phage S-CRM01 TaxID=1026955 RepID=UPI000209E3F4|nr:hypothetical protein SCRM01_163c [Synechococcus phage S-CRM01]AEC53109.1 hypothetical protein SCRM01_163c [Synechococcus phage S-CRM01]
MTNLLPIDIYNSYMNMEASSYPHGSWMTYEDMQISALAGAIHACVTVDDYGTRIIYVDELDKLIKDLEDQSNKLKKNKQ